MPKFGPTLARIIPLREQHFHNNSLTTLLRIPKGLVELGNSNTCAEVKLCLFPSVVAIVCHKIEVLKTVSSG